MNPTGETLYLAASILPYLRACGKLSRRRMIAHRSMYDANNKPLFRPIHNRSAAPLISGTARHCRTFWLSEHVQVQVQVHSQNATDVRAAVGLRNAVKTAPPPWRSTRLTSKG